MSTIGTSGVQVALAEFVDQRIMTAIGDDNSALKWLIGGASTLFLGNIDKTISHYAQMLKSIGIMDESGNLDIDKAEAFIHAAFAKQQTVRVPMMGVPITFDKSDGDALIAILRKQVGE